MNSEYILKADVLDIIFENRNKTYGAYALRKFYHERLYKAIGVTMAMALAVTALTFLPKGNMNNGKPVDMETTVLTLARDEPHDKPLEPKKPEQPKVDQPKPKDIQPVRSEQFTDNVVITKDEKHVDKISSLDSAVISDVTNRDPNAGTKQTVGVPSTPKPGDGGGEGKETVMVVDKETPRPTADIMPEFPGGIPALRKFLEKNLQNPEDLEEGQSVSVKVKFVVGYDGRLKGFETTQDGGKAFNNEVIRVLKKMPDWIPGKASGQNVSVYYVIPVQFTSLQ
ncbi:energy transducer TonB [Ferruginibacter sp. HRS2-29]|uniref:energy transducer TonB n=1 Tax=Ferruginibacter sp. HRS2-29 TaxID=2487334 RepID=UPI0020CFE565|nr:energy transducer TonB [Ferruginibacter sp. HRS2-29]MCP9750296.1 hypothetical protein [Ferruginibacter sp. HRS2-29]MCP9751151.1 hypothetical protein [Ferruginibacter sp. HRS2-29]